MQRLRILHVTPAFEPAWAYGGVPRLAGTLARGLARRGHDVTVMTTDVRDAGSRCDPEERVESVGEGRLRVLVFRNLSNRLAWRHQLYLPVGLGAALGREAGGFDVGHLHACRNLPGVAAARALFARGIPYVVQPNGTAPRIERKLLAKRLFDATFGRRFLLRAARLLAVAAAEERDLERLGVGPARIVRLPNPVDLDEWRREPASGAFRSRAGLGDRPLVLFLGKITPRKRVDLLLDAMVAPGLERATLVVAGSDMGPGRELERQAKRLGLGDRVRFVGLLEGTARLEALTDADAVAYPSEQEIFGLVPLEALLSGSPVVVADDSGCGELVRETGGGLVVAAGSAAPLADALRRLLSEPAAWRQRARDAARVVRERFAADVVCARLESIYAELAGGRRGA